MISPPSVTAPNRSAWLVPLAVAVLLALHYALAVGSKLQQSTTSDEIVHLTGGYTFDALNDYRLHPENGVLPQRWAALPTALRGAKYPPLDPVYWQTSDAWVMGREFFYETGEDHFPKLMAGRAMIAWFSVATGLLVFWWSRYFFGLAGGFVSLGFFVFSPTFLAHGALATSDACMTFFFLASVTAWWRHLHDGRARTWWLSAVVFGLACVAKFSAPFLLPMMVAMAAVRALSTAPLTLGGRTFTSRGGKFGAAAVSALGQGLVAALVIWAFFGFRYSASNPALPPALQFIRSWATIDANIGVQGKIIRALAAVHALPEAFLYGCAYVVESAQVRAAFLNREFSITGWPSFFPWTFLLKTTVPLLGACLLLAGLGVRRWWKRPTLLRGDLYPFTPLIALFAIYWAISVQSHLNIGHRHIMPTYPVLFIAAGALGAWVMAHGRAAAAVVLALLGWHATEAMRIAPYYLAYFNQLGGGPAEGHRHLVDSSLDWGQDLPGLARWLEANAKNEQAYLSYFGTGSPSYYGIKARLLTMVNGFKFPELYVPLEPGVYCISASCLEHVYSPVRGDWTLAWEKEYQELRKIEPDLLAYETNPARRAELQRDAPEKNWNWVVNRHQILRFARLCYYLRVRQADANIGYSIFIYRLTAEEIAAATGGSLAEWQALIERTVAAPAAR